MYARARTCCTILWLYPVPGSNKDCKTSWPDDRRYATSKIKKKTTFRGVKTGVETSLNYERTDQWHQHKRKRNISDWDVLEDKFRECHNLNIQLGPPWGDGWFETCCELQNGLGNFNEHFLAGGRAFLGNYNRRPVNKKTILLWPPVLRSARHSAINFHPVEQHVLTKPPYCFRNTGDRRPVGALNHNKTP